MEVEMNGAVYKHYENPGEGNKEEPSQKSSHESQEVSESGIEASETNTSEPVISSETIASEIEHFSRLSSELTELLSNISQKIANSEEQLRVIQSTVDLKTAELKRLHNIEAGAVALEQLAEDHRLQKEGFERVMDHQHRLWEEEKAQREREDREYLENLKIRREQEEREFGENLEIQRQREEQEFQRMWATEKSKARQQLEEELRAIEQNSREKQEAMERNCLERELLLKQKELEWVQLVQELEQFMSQLTKRIQSKAGSPRDLQKREFGAAADAGNGESPSADAREPENEPGSDPASGTYS
jgi:hypothetical protein